MTDLMNAVIATFEHEYKTMYVESIEPTTIKCIPESFNAFTLVSVPRSCKCTPKCCQEAIALQHGQLCAFIDSNHYSEIDQAVRGMLESQ